MTKLIVLAAITFTTAVLVLPGFAFVATPARQSFNSKWWLVGAASTIPSDGTPQLRSLRQVQMDGWLRFEVCGPQVFVRRLQDSSSFAAFPTYHLSNRIPVGITYIESSILFRSVCRGVDFDLNGRLIDAKRLRYISDDLERLQVEEDNGRVYVVLN